MKFSPTPPTEVLAPARHEGQDGMGSGLFEKRMLRPFSEESVYRAVVAGDLEIDEHGQVWRVRKRGWDRWNRKVVSRPCKRVRAEHDTGQYLMVTIMIDRARRYTQASRLVWRHFNGPIPVELAINHKDGNKKNNLPSNLEAVTYSKNTLHALHVLHKNQRVLNQDGQKNHTSKLTDEQVSQIRLRYAAGGVIMMDLANEFGVRFQQISRIVRGQRRALQAGPVQDHDLRHPSSVRDEHGRFARIGGGIP